MKAKLWPPPEELTAVITKELGFEPTKAQVVEHLTRHFLGAT